MTIAQPYARFERQVGYIDPNPDLGPAELYGYTPTFPGVLYRMRRAHSIIRTYMDERARQLARITFEVRPRVESPSPAQQQAARMVGEVLTGMRHKPLSVLMSEIDDRIATFGHAACQLVGRGDFVEVVWIEPYVIRRWETYDCRRRLRGLTYDSGLGWQTLLDQPVIWFGQLAEEGNFWGTPELRGWLALFALYEQEVTCHMDQRILEAGIIYTEETEAGASDTAVTKTAEWQNKLYDGIRAPIHFPNGIKPGTLQSSSPSMDKTVPMLQYLDASAREYMGAMLGSLGISGTGARALGETFELADRERLLSHAEGVAVIASGLTSANVRLIRQIGEWLGIDPDDDPIIAVAERPSRAGADRATAFAGVVQSGIWPVDRITDAQRRAIIEDDLGLPYPDGSDIMATRDGLVDADGTPSLYYPPDGVSRLAAAGLARRLEIPADQRGLTWRDDVLTARRLSDGDGFGLGEVRQLVARLERIGTEDDAGLIRRAMLGGDDVESWALEVLG